jgi:hypothetical protein
VGRLSNLRVVDPVLSQLALGYSNAEYVADLIMPIVEVEKEGGKIPKFGKEAFKLYNTERALRANSNRINPEGLSSVDIALDEHDLEYPIDYREDAEAAFNLQAHATFVATEGIQLRREKMVADLVQAQASYPAENKIVLSGNACFNNAASNPIGVIETGKEAIRSKIGRYPNTLIMGASVYSVLKQHEKLLDRIKYAMKGIVTTDLLREIFEIPHIGVGRAVFSSDKGVFSDVWSDNIVLAYVPGKRESSQRTPYEPSFGYTLRKRNNPVVDTRVEDGKIEVIRSTDIFKPYLLGAEAGYLIFNTNA